MEGSRKRTQDNLNLFRLIIDPKEQSKIQKTLSRKETQSKRIIINTRTKTFYKFRKLEKKFFNTFINTTFKSF